MAISGSIAGPDITGIGSAIGAIADEASEVMNEFDRPNWRWVHITKTKNSTSRQEFAFSKFDFVFYAIAGACVYKGIKEHIAGGSFYDFVKQELSNVLNSLRSEIQKMVASAGIGGVAGMFTGNWPGGAGEHGEQAAYDVYTMLLLGPITGPFVNYLRRLMGDISSGMSDNAVVDWWKKIFGIPTGDKDEGPPPSAPEPEGKVNEGTRKAMRNIGLDIVKIAPYYRDAFMSIANITDRQFRGKTWLWLYEKVKYYAFTGKTPNDRKLTVAEHVDMRNFLLYIEQNWNEWTT